MLIARSPEASIVRFLIVAFSAPETLIAWYKGLETDGMKHLTVQASNNGVGKVLKVGDEVTYQVYKSYDILGLF